MSFPGSVRSSALRIPGTHFHHIHLHLVIIWVLWLATAADTAQFALGYTSVCSRYSYLLSVIETKLCHEYQAIEGFAFLIWMLREFTTVCFMSYLNLPLVNFAVMVYSIIVLVMAIIGSSRGYKTWTNSVKNANFLGPTEEVVPPAEIQPAPLQPSMQQYHYAPPNSHFQGYAMPPIPPVSPYHATQGSHGLQVPSPQNSPPQGYAMPPTHPVSPHHGTQGSHGSQLPSGDYVQGPTYV